MDLATKQWLIGLIVLLIVVVLVDGVRRMRNARRNSLHMSLKGTEDNLGLEDDDAYGDDAYGSDFPNGGARSLNKTVDTEYAEKEMLQDDNVATDQWVDAQESDEDYLVSRWEEEEQEQPAENIEEEEVALPEQNPEPEKEKEPVKASKKESSDDVPQQGSLNLEEPVPVLMDTVDDAESIRSVGKNIKPSVEPTIGDDVSLDDLEVRSANKPSYESRYFSSSDSSQDSNKGSSQDSSKDAEVKEEQHKQEVLVINVKAVGDNEFNGSDILQQVLENGMRYGAMNIFHSHADEDGEGPILYSMANMLKPGIFDLKTIDTFKTVGVSFFLTLPIDAESNMDAFDKMLTTAENVAKNLGGELKDEQRSVMTAQTVEHYRERIRDFSRRQKLEQSKR